MMFDGYSFRARQVIFLARGKAGERGSNAVEIEDLLVALVIEDQGGFHKAVGELHGRPASADQVGPSHRPFLAPDVANDLLARIEAASIRSDPVPTALDMPVSEGGQRAFAAAADLQNGLQQKRVEPLHLLAAVAADESSRGAQMLREAGITRERVVEAIREEAQRGVGQRSVRADATAATLSPPVHSKRGRQVLSLAHFKSRARGAPVIEVEDLLAAFLLEDQGRYVEALSEIVPGVGFDMDEVGLRPRRPFVAPVVADDLLARLEACCGRSKPLTWRATISMSEGVKRTFAVADLLRDALRQREIEPLHLLAAIVAEESSRAAQMLREAGTTRERVLEALRNDAGGF